MGFTRKDITLDLLEGVAMVRYALLVVADLLQQQVNKVEGAFPPSHTESVNEATVIQLLKEARQICTMVGINTIDMTSKGNTTGPVVYLMKVIVRQWGFGCLKQVIKGHQWVMPAALRQDKVRVGGLSEGGKN